MTSNAYFNAELALYIILAIPTLYVLWCHRPHGLLGWTFLFLFCTIRIIGGALSTGSNVNTGRIISSVGLSPLLAATSGILHEARTYRHAGLDQKLEWIYVLFYHIIIVAGVALLAAGVSSLQSGTGTSTDLVMVKVGISILAAAWGILVLWACLSLLPSQKLKSSSAYWEGAKLLQSVFFVLVLLAIRVFYSVASLVTGSSTLDPVDGSLAVRVVLVLLPELIVVLGFLIAGFVTQNVRKSLAPPGLQTDEVVRQNINGGEDELRMK